LMSIKETVLNTAFLLKAGLFFPVIDDKIKPFHKSLTDWVTDRSASNAFFINKEDAESAMGELHHKLFNVIFENTDEINDGNNYCIKYAPVHLYKAGMKNELQDNFARIINSEKEIYAQFIAGVDNLLDWVVENKINKKETLFKKILSIVTNESTIETKFRFSNFLTKKAERYKKSGNSDWALFLFETGLAINLKLAQTETDRTDFGHALTVCLTSVGEIYKNMGDSKKALWSFEKSLAVMKLLIAKEPNRIYFRFALSKRFVVLGDFYNEMGDTKKALEFSVQSLMIMESLVAMETDQTDFTHALSESFNSVGRIYSNMGDTKKALEFFEKSLSVIESLVAMEPNSSDLRRGLSRGFNNVGLVYKDMGDNKKALEFFEKSLSVMEALVAMEPDRTDFRHDLSNSINAVGVIYGVIGDANKSLEFFEKSLLVKESLVAMEPDRTDFSINYASSLWNIYLICPTDEEFLWLNKAKNILERWVNKGVINQQLTQLWGMVNEAIGKIENK